MELRARRAAAVAAGIQPGGMSGRYLLGGVVPGRVLD
jgi:hypothetical protein